MNIALWVVSIVLALAFIAAGGLKLVRPKEQLVDRMVRRSSPPLLDHPPLDATGWGDSSGGVSNCPRMEPRAVLTRTVTHAASRRA